MRDRFLYFQYVGRGAVKLVAPELPAGCGINQFRSHDQTLTKLHHSARNDCPNT